MSGSRTWRRWVGVATATAVTAGLVIGVTAPAEAAAAKAKTSITVADISKVEVPGGPLGAIFVGDRATIDGTASKNLIGKRLGVQLKKGSSWVHVPGSGVVGADRTFSITVTATVIGLHTYRALYAGSSKLKASSGSHGTGVFGMFPLEHLAPVSTIGSASPADAPHVQSNIVANGTTYPSVLAGTLAGNEFGSVEFHLHAYCAVLVATAAKANGSALRSTATFSVYADGNQKASQVVTDSSSPVELAANLNGATELTIRNQELSPSGFIAPPPYIAAWLGAQLWCLGTP